MKDNHFSETKKKFSNGAEKKKIIIIVISIVAIMAAACLIWFFWDPFHKDKSGVKITPTGQKAKSKLEIRREDLPIVKMSLTNNNHSIYFMIEKIPPEIDQLEYELIYNAKDREGREFPKGQSGSSKSIGEKFEKEVLMGTESCTTGVCRYFYDENVSNGDLLLTFANKENQVVIFKVPFIILKPKKTMDLSFLSLEDLPGLQGKIINKGQLSVIIHSTLGIPQLPGVENYYGPFLFSTDTLLLCELETNLEIYTFDQKTQQWVKSSEALINPNQFFLLAD